MAAITLRSVKGSALTNAEVDANFTNLNTELGTKVTLAQARAGLSVTGAATYDSATGVLNVTGGVTSVNGYTGTVSLTKSDLGLGNVENKSSATIRSELTSSNVTTALGFTPYNATNPSGYISGITSSMVTTALGFTPPSVTGSGASGTWGISITGNAATVSSITSSQVTTALGFTPYNSTNPSGYITSSYTGFMLRSTAVQANPNTNFNSSAYRFDPNANNPTNDYYAIVTYGNESNVVGQLATHFQTGQTFTRAYNSSWSAWRTQLDSSNYSSYALPLGGGTLTGSLSVPSLTNSAWYYFGDPNRDANHADYYPNASSRSFRFAFVTSTSVGTGGNYAGLFHLAPWTGTTASTGDASYQLAFGSTAANGSGDPRLRLRKGIDTTWNSWVDVLTSANYTSYSPGYVGGGGAIRIQTASGYVDVGPMNTGYSHFQTDRDKFYFNKDVYVDGQIYKYNGGAYLHTGNYNSYALPLNGGTLTGAVTYTTLTSSASVDYGIVGNNGYFDTINSGVDTDPLELVYHKGSLVKIGSGSYGSKPLYASALYQGGRRAADAALHSQRDFANGTIISTDIDYSVSSGDPWVLEITGNSYGGLVPFDIQVQGYIYNDTIINYGGISNGRGVSGMVALNVGGNLTFWFPRQAYWQGFEVRAYVANTGYPYNRVTSITDGAKPSGTKEVALSSSIRQSLHSENYNAYAPTLTGTGATGTWAINISGSAAQLNGYASAENGNGVVLRTASNGYLNIRNWIDVLGTGLYSSSTNGAHFYPNATSYTTWRVDGSRNGYNGISFAGDATYGDINLMTSAGGSLSGFYNTAYGWQFYWSGGVLAVSKQDYGGGTMASVLDSGNYASYALPLGGGTVTGGVYFSANSQGANANSTIRVQGDITVARGNAGSGVIYLGNSGSSYVYYDGANYFMPTGQLDVNGSRVLHAANYTNYAVARTEYKNFGTIYIAPNGSDASCTTAQFISHLNTLGMFSYSHSVAKCAWSYSGNNDISDTGFGTFELAGCVIETFSDGSNRHVRVTRPNTGSGGAQTLVYNDQGSGYSPGWRQYITSEGGTLNGNLNFSGTGLRITGDFSTNTTQANRVMFQSSTTNGVTIVSAIPNGTSTTARWVAYNSSDPGNASSVQISALSTDIRIASNITGSGTLLPLTMYAGTTQIANFATTGEATYYSILRARGWWGTPATGSAGGLAAEMGVSGGTSYVIAYDRDQSAYGPLNFGGSVVNVYYGALQQGGNQVLHAANYGSYALPLSAGTSYLLTNELVRSATGGVDGAFLPVLKYGTPGDLQSGTAQANRWIGLDATITAGAAVSNVLRVRAYPGTTANASPVSVAEFCGDQSTKFYGATKHGEVARPIAQWGVGGASTGMVIIKFPGTTSNYGMVHAVIDIYEYSSNNVSTIIVGGHNWSSGWVHFGANVVGYTDKQVRVGIKDGQYCIVIGTSGSYWSYGQVVLRKIHNGTYYSGVMDLGGTFSISQTTTESFTSISSDLRQLRAVGITDNGSTVLNASNYSNYAMPVSGGTFAYTGDSSVGFNKTSGSEWNYLGFYYAGSRRMYFGVDSGGAPILGSDQNKALGIASTGGISLNGPVVTSGAVATTDSVKASKGLIDNDTGILRLTNPGGAKLWAGSGSNTGAIKIRLPVSWTDTMIRFTVKVYTYDGNSYDISCGGYNYSNGSWINTFAYMNTQSRDSLNVRFGHDGTYCCVYIGETSTVWNYCNVFVTDFQAGYNAYDSRWVAGWDVSYATSLGTITSTQIAYRPLHSGNYSSYALPLSGGNMTAGIGRADHHVGHLVGSYNSVGANSEKSNPIYTIGSSYNPTATSLSSMYGIGYSHSNFYGNNGGATGWGFYVAHNGSLSAVIGWDGAWFRQNVTAYSDERLKTDWAPLANDFVGLLAQVKSGSYTRIDSGDRQVGVSAQSLRNAMPEAVIEGTDGMLSVAHGNAALASAVELAKEVVRLRAEIEAIKALIRSIK